MELKLNFKKKLNKKGVFFTFIAIFTVIIIVAMVSTRQKYRYSEKSNAISARIRTMNNFIEDYEKDVERALYIGGYRALISMNSYIKNTEKYITDFDAIFTEILVNGTANNTQMELMQQEGQGASIHNWVERINEEASELNINININVNKVTLEHINPWKLNLKMNLTSFIADTKGLAFWNITKVYSKEFYIFGFEDPLYTIGTSDKITVLINITPDLNFVDKSTNDTSVLINHIENNFYINNTRAPSYLMRFTGNFSESPYGIESMVNPEEINAQLGSYKLRSLIDYIYFGNQTTSDYCNFNNMPYWFRLDEDHLELYQLDELEKAGCP